jgi:hypothetical protein
VPTAPAVAAALARPEAAVAGPDVVARPEVVASRLPEAATVAGMTTTRTEPDRDSGMD